MSEMMSSSTDNLFKSFENDNLFKSFENVINLEEDNVLKEPIVNDVEGNVHEELRIDDIIQCESNFVFNPENSKIKINVLFPDVDAF
jgi:hypothetical protein